MRPSGRRQVIGLSILSGAHNAIVPRVMELLRQKEMNDVIVIVGGIVPDQDVAQLKKIGVAQFSNPAPPSTTSCNSFAPTSSRAQSRRPR